MNLKSNHQEGHSDEYEDEDEPDCLDHYDGVDDLVIAP